ncbi:MAG: heme-binding domain-containing protein [Opitutae bacterium]|nr:heme-binding domain-containing protein [Opitutae bacterium]
MLKRLLFVFVALALLAQVIRPAKNSAATSEGPDSLAERLQAPPQVRQVLATACYDCHSNRTRYPWYAEIQPSGWFLAYHVKQGKEALNLSTFGRLGARTQAKRLRYMVDEMTEREMPLKSYTLMHRDAVLTDEQIRTFTDWAEPIITRLGRD